MCSKLTPYYDLTDEEGRGRNVENIYIRLERIMFKVHMIRSRYQNFDFVEQRRESYHQV